ncbi:MAG: Fe-S cluster assembly protein NifU [Candidatus Gastranaerophilales bacterium]|nr:Fe-S cluster assembly protein NifU [Candidatus Gastranaerophilales bacterium]
MWDYSEKVMEHYRNPKNVGAIDDADAIGEAGSLSCGDMLKLYLKVDEKGIITDAKFQTFGCGSAVASSSILTEMVIGKHIDDARKITNKQIVDALGGLPPEKMHCSVMGHEALEAAIANYYNEEITIKHDDEDIVCHCFNISKTFLENEIKNNGLKTIEDVINYTKAGGACGRCQGKIKETLDEINNGKISETKLTKTQMIIKINNIIEKYISSELRKDGGDIELIDVEDNKIKVKLTGRCQMCNRSQLTLTHFVEATLREHIDDSIEIVQV